MLWLRPEGAHQEVEVGGPLPELPAHFLVLRHGLQLPLQVAALSAAVLVQHTLRSAEVPPGHVQGVAEIVHIHLCRRAHLPVTAARCQNSQLKGLIQGFLYLLHLWRITGMSIEDTARVLVSCIAKAIQMACQHIVHSVHLLSAHVNGM